MLSIERTNNKGEIEVAICPLCDLQIEFMGAPMVRCYTTGETHEQDEVLWTPKSWFQRLPVRCREHKRK